MKRYFFLLAFLGLSVNAAVAQIEDGTSGDGGTFASGDYRNNRKTGRSDSIQSQHKEIPRGMKVWTEYRTTRGV